MLVQFNSLVRKGCVATSWKKGAAQARVTLLVTHQICEAFASKDFWELPNAQSVSSFLLNLNHAALDVSSGSAALQIAIVASQARCGFNPFEDCRAKIEDSSMNKGELVDVVAVQAGVTKKEADEILTATLDVIKETVANGEKVSLIGFGAFEPRQRSAREGRNPKTGEKLTIPATTVPAFSAGKPFKAAVAK